MVEAIKPSPALAVVGRHNSGKTHLIEKLIAVLVEDGYDVGSIKHHSHSSFEIDIPGKDSYRHRAAGASETVISAPGMMAKIKTTQGQTECNEIVAGMPGHDIVIVEGYRKSGLPTIEIMRAANPSDAKVAQAFVEGARRGLPLSTDFVQVSKDPHFFDDLGSLSDRTPGAATVAVMSDIPEVHEAAALYGIASFDINDVRGLADEIEAKHMRARVSVVIQAGGESKRMGQNKSLVSFGGRPLICRLIERVSPAADELIITTNEPERLEFLYEQYPNLNIKMTRDLLSYRGALPGLYTAFKTAEEPYVAVVACDMVFASASLISAEAYTISQTPVIDAVIPVNKHGYEPFHAIYRKATCLPAIEAQLKEGEKRAQSFFDSITVREFTKEEVTLAAPTGGCFVNVNTPEELHALEDRFIG